MLNLPQTPSFRLDGKRALVAGASSGIGLGCAVALAKAGADVTVAARRADALDELVATLRAENCLAQAMPLDVTDIDRVKAELGAQEPFDILVNSAGLARHSPVLETKPEDFDAVSEINLKGAYFLAQTVAQNLIAAKRPGSIMTISSQMAHVGGIDRAVYCGTKHGVEGFTKAMAIEFGPHQIRINTICPTFIKTDFTAASFEDPVRRAWIEDKIKLNRIGEVEDVMGAAVFLASDASSLVTGTSLLIDGGWTAD